MELKNGYKQTEVGVIPEDWEVMNLGSFAAVSSGGTPSRKNQLFWNGNIPWVTTSKIDFNLIEEADEFITEDGVNNSAAKIYKSGTLLMAMYGQGKTRGKVAILGIDATTNQACAAISLNHDVVKDYIFYNLSGRYDEIRALSNTGNQENLNGLLIKKIPIPLPPTREEQTAIATALSDTDTLISRLEALIAKKRAIKQGAMQQLLKPKEGWEVKTLGEILEKIVGGGTPSRTNSKYWGGTIPWVTVKDFATYNPSCTQEYITKEGLINSASNLIPSGTLITSTRMALGRAVIYEVDVSVNQDLKAIFPKKDISTLFLYYWFQFNSELIESLGSGSTVMGISLPDLKQIEFSKPLKPEQTRIAQILSDMDAEIAGLEQKLAKYKQVKQGMMQELLTGKTRLV